MIQGDSPCDNTRLAVHKGASSEAARAVKGGGVRQDLDVHKSPCVPLVYHNL